MSRKSFTETQKKNVTDDEGIMAGKGLMVRLPPNLMHALDDFRRGQPDLPNQSESIRRILSQVLFPTATTEVNPAVQYQQHQSMIDRKVVAKAIARLASDLGVADAIKPAPKAAHEPSQKAPEAKAAPRYAPPSSSPRPRRLSADERTLVELAKSDPVRFVKVVEGIQPTDEAGMRAHADVVELAATHAGIDVPEIVQRLREQADGVVRLPKKKA
jgi:hypothetical protein